AAPGGSNPGQPAAPIALAAGDADNDGDPDLFVSSPGGARLYLNDGKGRFSDSTQGSGLEGAVGATSAVWLDADRDGDLDLALGGGGTSGGGGMPPRLYLNAAVYPETRAPEAEPPAGRTRGSPARDSITDPARPTAADTLATNPTGPTAANGLAADAKGRAWHGGAGRPRFLAAGTEAALPARGEGIAVADLFGRDDIDIAFASGDGSLAL